MQLLRVVTVESTSSDELGPAAVTSRSSRNKMCVLVRLPAQPIWLVTWSCTAWSECDAQLGAPECLWAALQLCSAARCAT